ncbi:hypothetical protein BKA70DRAFT_1423417 [Coprinopsis sp. MPI-PUGE-AT-0042]|nr:hypothetical protein BKA70DRAFT_1423417 [Coprinopsis sp. MPI-PUGE-AT-0042]
MNQLGLFGEADEDQDPGSSTNPNSPCSSCRDPENISQPKRFDSLSYLPQTAIASSSNHATRVLLCAFKPYLMLGEMHRAHPVEEGRLVILPELDDGPKNRLAIKELSLSMNSLILELNQPEALRDPYNRTPPMLALARDRDGGIKRTSDESSDKVYAEGLPAIVAREEFGTLEGYAHWFVQLLEGLLFYATQRLFRINCSSLYSFMVGYHPSLSHLPSDELSSSGNTCTSGIQSGDHDKPQNSAAPQFYFMDFSNAERMPSIELESARPLTPSAQQDVHDLGTLFSNLISAAPSNVSSTLSDHFALLISAMTEGGFTADESRRLHEMISRK